MFTGGFPEVNKWLIRYNTGKYRPYKNTGREALNLPEKGGQGEASQRR